MMRLFTSCLKKEKSTKVQEANNLQEPTKVLTVTTFQEAENYTIRNISDKSKYKPKNKPISEIKFEAKTNIEAIKVRDINADAKYEPSSPGP